MLSPVAQLGLAALVGIVAFSFVTGGGQQARRGPPVSEVFDTLAMSFGLGINQVEITGHRFTLDSSIHEALDLAQVRSMLRLDSAAARQRIEQLPWIETAHVTRLFPDRLKISVTERKAFARWQRGVRVVLIDRTGRMLAQVQAGAVAHLPLVTGDGAAEEAADLLSVIGRHPTISARLEAADRIDGRRWSLRLQGGSVVHLPAEGTAAAIDRLAASDELPGVKAMTAAVVDMRVPGRMIVRRGEVQGQPPLVGRDERPAAPGGLKDKQGAQRG